MEKISENWNFFVKLVIHGKLVLSPTIMFDDDLKVTHVTFFASDFSLSSCVLII